MVYKKYTKIYNFSKLVNCETFSGREGEKLFFEYVLLKYIK